MAGGIVRGTVQPSACRLKEKDVTGKPRERASRRSEMGRLYSSVRAPFEVEKKSQSEWRERKELAICRRGG